MNRITAPLRQGDTGAAVADLQVALQEALHRGAIELDEQTRAALLEKLDPELARKAFRDATAELLKRFQEQRQLATDNGVDEPTAQALNALLVQWGLLDGSGSPARAEGLDTSFALRVTVLDGRQAPIPGLTVRA